MRPGFEKNTIETTSAQSPIRHSDILFWLFISIYIAQMSHNYIGCSMQHMQQTVISESYNISEHFTKELKLGSFTPSNLLTAFFMLTKRQKSRNVREVIFFSASTILLLSCTRLSWEHIVLMFVDAVIISN